MKRSQARFSFIFINLKPCKTFDQRSLNGQKKKNFNATYSSHDLDIYHHKRRKLFFLGGGESTRAKMGNELGIILCSKWEVIRLLIFGYVGLGSLDERATWPRGWQNWPRILKTQALTFATSA